MTKKICFYPDPVLLTEAKPITQFDESLETLINEMAEAMYEAKGIGLAAPQIGVGLQIFIMDLERSVDGPEIFINPEIEVLDAEKVVEHEGCLSLPGAGCNVPRYKKVRLKAKNEKGEDIEVEATGLKSACFQHECDHLKGRLYISHLSNVKRQKMIKDFRKHTKA